MSITSQAFFWQPNYYHEPGHVAPSANELEINTIDFT